MQVVIQRVSEANITVADTLIATIQQGMVALIGLESHDNKRSLTTAIDKMIHYRIFNDHNHKMNNSLVDIDGSLLLVPQFTLVADTSNGKRPGFSAAAPPSLGQRLFADLCLYAKTQPVTIACGQFGANMQVQLINDGPVTFTFCF